MSLKMVTTKSVRACLKQAVCAAVLISALSQPFHDQKYFVNPNPSFWLEPPAFNIHLYMHAYRNACTHACTPACTHAYAYACRHTCLHICLRTCPHTCPTHMPYTHAPTHIPSGHQSFSIFLTLPEIRPPPSPPPANTKKSSAGILSVGTYECWHLGSVGTCEYPSYPCQDSGLVNQATS